MLPDARVLARWDQDLHFGRVLIQCIIDFTFVVGAIRSTRKQGLFDLGQQLFHNRIIADVIPCQGGCQNLTRVRIAANMQFALGTML